MAQLRAHLKHVLGVGQRHDAHLQEHRDRDRPQQPGVGEEAELEGRHPVAAATDREEQLAEGRHAEGHRPRMRQSAGIAAPRPPEGGQRHRRHDQAVGQDQRPAGRRDHRLARRPRRSFHDVGLRRLEAERQRRQPVGDEVEPQDLNRRQGRRPASQRRHEHHEHLPRVARKQVVDELLDVVVDATPLLDGRHDRGEVVVDQHHVGGRLRHVGARDAHRDPDVGGLDRRGVVDPVAGHRYHGAGMLQGLDHAQLVLRRDASVDGDRRRRRDQRRLVEPVELGAGHGPPRPVGEPELACDRQSGGRMVAGDHHGPDPGRATPADRPLGLVAGRVDHPHESHVHEPPLGLVGLPLHRLVGSQRPTCERQHPQCLVGQPLGHGEDLPPPDGAERHVGAVDPLGHAAGQHRLGGPLRLEHPTSVGELHDHAHPLAVGVEGDLEHDRLRRLVPRDAPLERRHHERALGGISHHLPGGSGAAGPHLGVVAAGRDLEQPREVGLRGDARGCGVRRVRGRVDPDELPLGRIARAGHVPAATGRHHLPNGHLVAGQRAGLVRADHRDAAQGLDARQPAHQRVPGHHPLQADRQDHRNHGRQPLGDRRHRQADRPQEHLRERAVGPHRPEPAMLPDLEPKNHRHNRQGDDDQDPAEFRQSSLQRGGLGRGGLEQAGDPAQFALHPGGHDHRRRVAGGHDGSGVDHRRPVAEGGVGRHGRRRGLLHRHALAGERGLLEPQRKRLHEPGVGRHGIARLEFDPIAGHDLASGNRACVAVADHLRQRCGQPLERGQRRLGPLLLKQADHAVDQHDRHDRGGVGPVAEGSGDSRRDEQDHDHQLAERP